MGIEEYSYVSHRNCGKMQFCEFPDEFYWFSQNSSHSSPHVTVNSQFQTIHHAENVQNHLCRTYSPHNKAMKRSTKRWNVQTSTIPMEVIFCVPNVSKFHFASKHTHTHSNRNFPTFRNSTLLVLGQYQWCVVYLCGGCCCCCRLYSNASTTN